MSWQRMYDVTNNTFAFRPPVIEMTRLVREATVRQILGTITPRWEAVVRRITTQLQRKLPINLPWNENTPTRQRQQQ